MRKLIVLWIRFMLRNAQKDEYSVPERVDDADGGYHYERVEYRQKFRSGRFLSFFSQRADEKQHRLHVARLRRRDGSELVFREEEQGES